MAVNTPSERDDASSEPLGRPHVHVHDKPELSKTEAVTRMGCGALFGCALGFGIVIRLALSSYGVIGAVIALSICACAFLALEYGDRFWSGIFRLDWW